MLLDHQAILYLMFGFSIFYGRPLYEHSIRACRTTLLLSLLSFKVALALPVLILIIAHMHDQQALMV